MSQGGTGGGGEGGTDGADEPRRTSGGPRKRSASRRGRRGRPRRGAQGGGAQGRGAQGRGAQDSRSDHAGETAGQRGEQQRAGNQRAGDQRAAGQRANQPTGKQSNGRRRARWLRQVNEYSAGGLVVDLTSEPPRGALIARTDRHGKLLWSLPKGHIEHGETAEQAAVREVEEETGIAGTILAELGTIDFWFVAEGRRIHKTVQHYLMRAVGGELSDADIEVTEVAWVPLPDIRGQLAYPDERGLVDTAGRLLADTA